MKEVIAGILVSMAVATSASAASAPAWSFSARTGGYTFSGDERLNTKPSFGGSIAYEIIGKGFADSITVEASADYVYGKTNTTAADAVHGWLMRMEMLFPFNARGSFVPYLAAGGGGVIYDSDAFIDGKSPLLDYGVGARYFVQDNIAVRADVRHLMIFGREERNNVQYTLGLNVYFDRGTALKKLALVEAPLPEAPPAAAPAAVPPAAAPAPEAEPQKPVPAPEAAPKEAPAPASKEKLPAAEKEKAPAVAAKEAPAPAAEPAAPAPQGAALPKPVVPQDQKPAAPAVQPVVTKVAVVQDGIDFTITGGIERFETSRLSSPARIVIDIPGGRTSLSDRTVAVNSFGILEARLGVHPDRLRIVLDAAAGKLPEYRIEKRESGLKVVFPSK